MGYKKEIDKQRLYKEMIEFNLEQIRDDLITFDDKGDKLISEYQVYQALIPVIDRAIASLQPWYRRWLGFYY